MAVGSKDRKDREARAARERTRLYQARRQFHEGQARRRTRDNLIAGIVGGLLIIGIGAAQTAYFLAGPGAPEPAPTSTPTPTGMTPTPAPTATTPTPDPSPTP
ncbi:dioxygenase [Microbacterium sp. CPCC 204701]|uniref:dioxygenase n=1 Tax=Microbacterium sp. CPCC 204701 TaxID=2493084 RepID=UPI000FD7D62B|nr:dioxygenase [Microbacterium sp. CPCC 204701]